MKYLSICSGIEAASVAWEPLGWHAVGFSEIDPFASAVLQHRFPNVKNYGDMQKFREWGFERGSIDVLVGGTPCQSFSIAGLRKGIADPRGNLALTFVAMVDEFKPRWVIWENVPGVLSSGQGRDFGSILGALEKLGYGFAWRILDAQFFGVPQRRRRVFLVANSIHWANPAKVLFEPESVPRDFKKSENSRQDTSGSTGNGIARCLTTGEGKRFDWETCTLIAQTQYGNLAGTLTANHDLSPCSDRGTNILVNKSELARRLMPIECERLQGFPDDWTNIFYRGKPSADSPRYKAIGNSMAVPVMRWIGDRIAKLEKANGPEVSPEAAPQ